MNSGIIDKKGDNNMFRLIPLLVVGAVLGGAALLSEYQKVIDGNEEETEIDFEQELKRLQKELSRLYHLQDTNSKLEVTGELDNIELSINGISISERIAELTERMEVVLKLKNENRDIEIVD